MKGTEGSVRPMRRALVIGMALVLLGCGTDVPATPGSAAPVDAYDEPRRPTEARLTDANFPTSLDDSSSCREYSAADLHDRSNFLRARKNLTKRGASEVDGFLTALCNAAVEVNGNDGGLASDVVPVAMRAALDAGTLDD